MEIHNFKFEVKQKLNIMKTLFKSKIILALIFMGVLFSCKDNKDGYSDEIVTKTPTDSSTAPADTVHGQNIGIESADSAKEDAGSAGTGNASPGNASPGTTGSGSTASGGSEGTGSGPGESAKDGSTYTSSSGAQKDSVTSGKKTTQKSKSTK